MTTLEWAMLLTVTTAVSYTLALFINKKQKEAR